MAPPLPPEAWPGLLGRDPRPWLLDTTDPSARWITLTRLLDLPPADPRVDSAHADVLTHTPVQQLIEGLPDWETQPVTSGHHSVSFTPNVLGLLADLGVGPGDAPGVERVLDQMLAHQDAQGRFQTLARWRKQPLPRWGSLLCDTHAIVDVLVRFARQRDVRVLRALECVAADVTATAQGTGWPCRPDPEVSFRGPGRKADVCVQVSLEALRVWARLPDPAPPAALDVCRTVLGVWRARGEHRPYIFGHGRGFKTVKWPTFWYGAYAVLDALSAYPALWAGPAARAEDRRALAELAACLIAYNVQPDGRVIPRSTYKGFEAFCFGQKKRASPVATAQLCTLLRRLEGLVSEIGSVDVLQLGSSKGGSGSPLPPRL